MKEERGNLSSILEARDAFIDNQIGVFVIVVGALATQLNRMLVDLNGY